MDRKKTVCGFLVSTILLLGCTLANRTESISQTHTNTKRHECDESDTLCHRMASISSFIESQGFFRDEPPNLSAKDAATTQTTIGFEQTTRVLIVAIGQETRINLDLTIRDREGQIIAADETLDARTVLSFVADALEAYTVQLNRSHGTGRFLLAVFKAHVSTPPIPTVGFFDADPIARTAWSDVSKLMKHDNFQAHTNPARIVTNRLESHSSTIKIRKDYCYTFVTTGSRGIDSLDVRLESEGKLLLADLTERPEAWIRYCPEYDSEVLHQIKINAGSGSVIWGSFVSHRNNHPQINGPKLELRSDSPHSGESFSSIKHELDRLGYSPKELLLKATAAAGSRFGAAFTLERGECAMIFSLTDLRQSALDLQFSISKKPVRTNTKDISSGILNGICASEASTYNLSLLTLTRDGKVEVFLRRLPPHPSIDIGDDPEALWIRQAIATFTPVGMTLQSVAGKESDSAKRKIFESSFEPEPSSCYGIAVVSSAPLLSVSVLNNKSEEISAWKGNESLAIMASCSMEGSAHKIRVTLKDPVNSTPVFMFFKSDSKLENIFRDSKL